MRKFRTESQLSTIDKIFLTNLKEIPKLSPAKKKQVGCIIGNHKKGNTISIGWNKHFESLGNIECEDNDGITLPYVIHAEEDAVISLLKQNHKNNVNDLTCYVTYAPCISCCKYLSHIGIKRIIYIEKHLFKFDNIKNSPMAFLNLMNIEVIEIIEEL